MQLSKDELREIERKANGCKDPTPTAPAWCMFYGKDVPALLACIATLTAQLSEARAAECEACAMVADQSALAWSTFGDGEGESGTIAARDIATAIRSRAAQATAGGDAP